MRINQLVSRLAIISVIAIFTNTAASQRIVDNDSYKTWVTLRDYSISNNGHYIWYTIVSDVLGRKLEIVNSRGDLLAAFDNIEGDSPAFSKNSEHLIFRIKNALIIYHLLNDKADTIEGVRSFSLFRGSDSETLSYIKDSALTITKLSLKGSKRFEGVTEYKIAPNGETIIIKTLRCFALIRLNTNRVDSILPVSRKMKYSFDNSGKKISIFVNDSPKKRLYSYDVNEGNLKSLISGTCFVANREYQLANNTDINFTPDGTSILVDLEPLNINNRTSMIGDEVEIRSHNDPVYSDVPIYSPAKAVIKYNQNPSAPLIISNADTEYLLSQLTNTYVIVATKVYDREAYWRDDQKPKYWLVSIRDGSRQLIEVPAISPFCMTMSNSARYIIFYDTAANDFFSIDLISRVTKRLTQSIKVPADIVFHADGSPNLRFNRRIISWTKNDASFIIKDRYDLWEIDPSGKKRPICLTNGFGRSNQVEFFQANDVLFDDNSKVLLTAFNHSNKENGFWEVKFGNSVVLKKLQMEPALYMLEGVGGSKIIKAKHRNTYLFTKQTASESPNLFITNNFTSVRKLTNINPEKEYNWIKSELLTFPLLKGKGWGQAILYKPQNFDSSKKYPVIFHYYQDRSQELHKFLTPGLSFSLLNIPWYVSNGYLVCVPDILNNPPGKIAETTVNSVESAVRYCFKFPWVDSLKIGLQGHSFGGFETNILVANLNLFAAAHSAAGISDLISLSGSYVHQGGAILSVEKGQFNLNTTPWLNLNVYLENSPILKAGQVTTPLLLSHALIDSQVPYEQSFGFYNALRRAGKKVWLLTYPHGGHTAGGLDATIRQQQFFNFYLKGSAIPKWMLDSKNTSFQTDSQGFKP